MNNLKTFLVKNEKQFKDFLPLFQDYQNKEYSNDEIEIFKKDIFGDNSIINIFISEINNKKIGFMILEKSYSTYNLKYYYYLQDFFVITSYRSKGIGTKMFGFLEKYLKENNIGRLTWITNINNIKAQKFYNKYNVDKSWLFYKMKINN